MRGLRASENNEALPKMSTHFSLVLLPAEARSASPRGKYTFPFLYFPPLLPIPHGTARHHTIRTSDAHRISSPSSPSTIQLGACYLRCFSFSCRQGIAFILDRMCCNCRAGLGIVLGSTYLFPLLTSKVLVCEPLFMSVWEGDEARSADSQTGNFKSMLMWCITACTNRSQ